jgi:hypothetical protein
MYLRGALLIVVLCATSVEGRPSGLLGFFMGLFGGDNKDDLEDPGGLPRGLVNPICKGLTNFAGGLLADQIPEEFQDELKSVRCGCKFNGLRDLEIGCDLAEPVCLPSGGEGLDGATRDLQTGNETSEICGIPIYRGTWFRPYRISGQKPHLESLACIELTGDALGGAKLSTLCIAAKSKEGVTGIANLESCRLYAVRSDGTKQECNSCQACPDSQLSMTFDCSNVDLDESPDSELFLPDLGDQCFASGLMSMKDIKSGEKGAYEPFMTRVN